MRHIYSLSRASFSTRPASKIGSHAVEQRKSLTPITRLSHVRLDLAKVLSENNLPLVR